MKRIINFLMFITIFISTISPIGISYANNETRYYAKIKNSETMLYQTENEDSAMFELPFSYFVEVKSNKGNFFFVKYKDTFGYVKKNEVQLMRGSPKKPYAAASFELFVPFSMYSTPTTSSKKEIELNTNIKEIEYYGKLNGESLKTNNSIWYYSKVTVGNEEHYGYIFSGVTDNLTKIALNTEDFEHVDESIFENKNQDFSKLSTNTKILLIVSISVPSILILYFLMKPNKIMQMTNKKSKREKIHKIHHKDYFEFDENEL